MMVTPSAPPPTHPTDGCAAQRSQMGTLCESSAQAQEAYGNATASARDARRDVATARRLHDAAVIAADPTRRRDEKAAARSAYEVARGLATTDSERTEATATWARAIDRANRSGRLARRILAKTRKHREDAEVFEHEQARAEQASRIEAQAAEAACLEARVRLAGCEEQAQAGSQQVPAGAPDAPAKHSALHGVTYGQPLVIEELLGGDRVVLEMVSSQIAAQTALTPAQSRLLMGDFVHAIMSAAAQHGFLVFEDEHALWSHLSVAEAGDVTIALAQLGFGIEPSEGWHAGRAPVSRDLSMALAYAGLDARGMRDLPGDKELLELPRSVGVDARAFLASQVPDLNLDSIVRVLGDRAATLTPLWEAWGQIRPILMREREAFDTSQEG